MDRDDEAKGNETDAETAKRENLCRRCGLCCHEKVRFGEQVVITDIPCPYLDTETNLCTVYPDRLAKQPRCATAELSAAANSLPGDCPYVGGRADYLEPHLLTEHPEYEKAITALFPGKREEKRERRRGTSRRGKR